MAAKKKDDADGKGAKAKAVPVALLLVGLFAGKTFLGGGGGAAAAGAEAGVTTTTAPGPVVTLGSTTVNLADGHVLKVGMALQLAADAKQGAEAKPDASDPTKGWAPVFNEAIQVFGDQTYAQLIAPGGRETARQLLAAKLKVRYAKDVEDLYFYEFVMQ